MVVSCGRRGRTSHSRVKQIEQRRIVGYLDGLAGQVAALARLSRADDSARRSHHSPLTISFRSTKLLFPRSKEAFWRGGHCVPRLPEAFWTGSHRVPCLPE